MKKFLKYLGVFKIIGLFVLILVGISLIPYGIHTKGYYVTYLGCVLIFYTVGLIKSQWDEMKKKEKVQP